MRTSCRSRGFCEALSDHQSQLEPSPEPGTSRQVPGDGITATPPLSPSNVSTTSLLRSEALTSALNVPSLCICCNSASLAFRFETPACSAGACRMLPIYVIPAVVSPSPLRDFRNVQHGTLGRPIIPARSRSPPRAAPFRVVEIAPVEEQHVGVIRGPKHGSAATSHDYRVHRVCFSDATSTTLSRLFQGWTLVAHQ